MPNNLEHQATQPVAVLILAAGESKRLGQPKQLLQKNGLTLLQHTINLALSIQPVQVVVVLNPQLAQLTQLAENKMIHIAINPHAATGMASSLQIGANCLRQHQGDILILGIDQPLLKASDLLKMIKTSQHHPEFNIANGYADTIGIPALVKSDLLQQSKQLSGDTGLKKLLLQQPEKLITLSAPQLAFDIDTPDALHHAIQQGWLDSATTRPE